MVNKKQVIMKVGIGIGLIVLGIIAKRAFNAGAFTMVFQLCRCAQKGWRRLDGYELLAKVVEGVKFVDGMEEEAAA